MAAEQCEEQRVEQQLESDMQVRVLCSVYAFTRRTPFVCLILWNARHSQIPVLGAGADTGSLPAPISHVSIAIHLKNES